MRNGAECERTAVATQKIRQVGEAQQQFTTERSFKGRPGVRVAIFHLYSMLDRLAFHTGNSLLGRMLTFFNNFHLFPSGLLEFPSAELDCGLWLYFT